MPTSKKKTKSRKAAPVAVAATAAEPVSVISSVRPHNFVHSGNEVMILRRCGKDRKSYGGFTYPAGVGATVEPEQWEPVAECANGLHGWPWGFGLGEGQGFSLIDDLWIVLGAKPEDVVGELGGGLKCKCRHATIRYEGSFSGALDFLREGQHACIVAMATVTIPLVDTATASSGNGAKLAASGNDAQLAASGNDAQLAASGYGAKLAASGYGAQLAASGYGAQLAASGNGAKLAASGNGAKLAASGNGAKLAASGNGAKLAASGYGAQLAASGYGAQLAASGNDAQLAASGYGAKLAASGNGAQLAASGYDAQLAASGYGAKLEATGENSVIAVAAAGGRVRVGPKGAFALAYYDQSDGWRFITGKAGENGIKAGTWYTVIDGKLAETDC